MKLALYNFFITFITIAKNANTTTKKTTPVRARNVALVEMDM